MVTTSTSRIFISKQQFEPFTPDHSTIVSPEFYEEPSFTSPTSKRYSLNLIRVTPISQKTPTSPRSNTPSRSNSFLKRHSLKPNHTCPRQRSLSTSVVQVDSHSSDSSGSLKSPCSSPKRLSFNLNRTHSPKPLPTAYTNSHRSNISTKPRTLNRTMFSKMIGSFATLINLSSQPMSRQNAEYSNPPKPHVCPHSTKHAQYSMPLSGLFALGDSKYDYNPEDDICFYCSTDDDTWNSSQSSVDTLQHYVQLEEFTTDFSNIEAI
ncbi:hypothetical protein CONCODRAFT_77144 [Conidiobolus coronatus NRRL 28638]|uniref:Uncharacterized protein n=1 Tax=Conidiobolus coronatus (strain ATCC 28846 / CBS 209.66 / NRRL 28638) TaxID=796925 RepID=A0A137PFV9_CONC2|nr:hypothetical protein CONCODRAFT_77144 [Conidiobolus coronatus NRRL 28638]|eukprot:KXN73887.1 hypothetical protein CONCODRAFT_77144 [Conidiobolus coronatus NRRL 28638]